MNGLLRGVRRDWNQFFFAPLSAVPLGIFRILYGLLVLTYAVLLFPDRFLWFSDRGVLSLAQTDQYNQYSLRFSLFHLGVGDGTLTLLFLVLMAASLLLTVGWWSRPAAFVVWAIVSSLHNRNGPILNSGDTVMLLMAFYLIFAPSEAACSLGRLWRVLKGQEGDTPIRVVPWMIRVIQIQVSVLYLCTGFLKLSGSRWIDGTAVYYPMHLPDMARFPMPLMDGHLLWPINLLTYFTLVVEIAMGTLVWVPRLRLYVLAGAVLLHLGIEYAMNVPLFSFIMIAAYCTFLTQTDFKNFVAWLRDPLWETRLRVVYDGDCDFCKSSLLVVHFFDVFRLLTFLDSTDPVQLNQAAVVTPAEAEVAAWAVTLQDKKYGGFDAFRLIAWRLPAFWFLAPFSYIPGIPQLGRRAYAWIATHRSLMPVAPRYQTPRPKERETTRV